MTTQVFQYHCYEICWCSQFPSSYYKQECTQCCASCMNTLVYCSQSGSCIWSPLADVQELEVVTFEFAQTTLHTSAIPSLWDEILQLILSILEFEGAHKGCDTLLLLKLVVMIVVLCGMFLKSPFQNNVYVRGNPVCQSTYHCRLVLEPSLLYLSHHVWGLNQNGTPLPVHGTYCLLWTC